MPEGVLCNKNKVTTLEQLQALLADKSGKQYYQEMNNLDVDSKALWDLVQKTCKSRTRTWLEICTHCGLRMTLTCGRSSMAPRTLALSSTRRRALSMA